MILVVENDGVTFSSAEQISALNLLKCIVYDFIYGDS